MRCLMDCCLRFLLLLVLDSDDRLIHMHSIQAMDSSWQMKKRVRKRIQEAVLMVRMRMKTCDVLMEAAFHPSMLSLESCFVHIVASSVIDASAHCCCCWGCVPSTCFDVVVVEEDGTDDEVDVDDERRKEGECFLILVLEKTIQSRTELHTVP